MPYLNKFAVAGLSASLALITACGPKDLAPEDSKPAGAAASITIPDAPDAAITAIVQEVSKGNAGIIWQAMPNSYQTDLNEVVQLAGNKIDGEVYAKVVSVLSRLGGIAKDKQAFILNTQLGSEPMPAEQQAELEQAWPSVVAIIDSITSSQLGSIDGLKAFDGQQFFGQAGSDLLKQISAISERSTQEGASIAELAEIAVSVVESQGDSAVLKMMLPDQPEQTESFTKVEGKWLPADMVAQWSMQIAGAKSKLNALTPEAIAETKTQAMMMVGVLEGVLTQLEAAQTQEQFDAALKGAMMPIMMMGMQMGGGLGGGGQVAPVAP